MAKQSSLKAAAVLPRDLSWNLIRRTVRVERMGRSGLRSIPCREDLVQMKSAVTTSAARFGGRKQATVADYNPSQKRRLNWRLILAIGLSLALWFVVILGAIKLIG